MAPEPDYPRHDSVFNKRPLPNGMWTFLPPEVEKYRHDIRRMIDAMVYKLKVHHKKGRWEDSNIPEMIKRMEAEITELKEAIANGNLLEIQMEAADVANFAMIIASIATERGLDSDKV
jgi:NTP pyrophosphatase (non-canonical NTP hydrolase)